MTVMKTSRIVIAAAFLLLGMAFIAPDYFPSLAWARYTAAAILLSPITALIGLIARAAWMGVRERARDRKAFRVASTSDGLDVLRASGIRVIDADEEGEIR